MTRSSASWTRIFADPRPALRVLVLAAAALVAAAPAFRVTTARAQAHDHPHAGPPATDVPPVNADSAAAADTMPPPPLPPAPPPALFIDLDRNLGRLTSARAIEALVDSAADAGFRRLVVDVKTKDGRVVFKSRMAATLDLGFDYFGAFRAAADRRGLELLALFQVLAEGDTKTKVGPAYDHPEWQTVVDAPNLGVVPIGQLPGAWPVLFVNPVLVNVQRYEVTVFSDLLQQLKPAGVVLDDLRFFNREADLGDSTRIAFDNWLGLSPVEWPQGVLDKASPRYPHWMSFRAGIIHEVLNRMRKLRDTVAPDTRLILMAHGYFEPALSVGVNWGHSRFKPPLWYAGERIRQRGLADLVDELILGSRDSNPASVQIIVQGMKTATHQERPLSVYLPVELFQNRPGRLIEVMDLVRANGLGISVGESGQVGALDMWAPIGETIGTK